MTVLICQCGFIKTLQILIRWPSYILMPMFSIFTFGTETIGRRKYLVCSTRWTLCNLGLTLAGLIFGGWFLYYLRQWRDTDFIITNIISALIVLAIVLYAIFMKVQSCCCLCSCSFIKRSGLDLDNMEVVFLEDLQLDSANGINMEEMWATDAPPPAVI